MSNEKPKEYEIDSFDKLVNLINEDNFEDLTHDLMLWLAYNVKVMKMLREKAPEDTQGKQNSEIVRATFIWIDDGKHNLREVKLKNDVTGEITIVNFVEQPNP